MISLLLIALITILASYVSAQAQLMKRVLPSVSGVVFSNTIVESDSFNVLRDFSAYNGGGVGVGDLDKDGLLDIVFTGTQVGITVYRNLGSWKFEDVTEKSGMNFNDGAINTGVTIADVTSDGWPDVYISRRYTRNLFFVNNGDGTFSERGLETGLGLLNMSTTTVAVVDYNRDGNPDLFIVNNGDPRRHGYLNPGQNDNLFRNNGDGTWTDVTLEAGIVDKGYGLNASVGDVNDDGWPDVFVANDFEERDKLWLNNGDGTFTDVASTYFQNMSWASMGSDIADVNDDGRLDILTVDMFPKSHYRRMTQLGGMSIYGPFFDSLQRVHNTVQINRGNNYFTNVCYLAGMAATDWSWSILAADFNNDGRTDVFVSNGVKRDIGDQDFLNNLTKPTTKNTPDAFLNMPTPHLPNCLFLGEGDCKFFDVASTMGMCDSLITNGACYADLDNDGDLDLVLNNTDSVAFIYQNMTQENNANGHNFLRVQLNVRSGYKSSLGTRVTVFAGTKSWLRESQASRGFHSSVDPTLHFGLGDVGTIDSVVVRWPDGSVQVERAKVNSTVRIDKKTLTQVVLGSATRVGREQFGKGLMQLLPNAFPFYYKENLFDDFKRERLVPYRFSDWGPGFTWRKSASGFGADVVLSAPKYSSSALYTFSAAGSVPDGPLWSKAVDLNSNESEQVAALFVDVNSDGVKDLYMVAGGNEFDKDDKELRDKLFIADKKDPNNLIVADENLPESIQSGSCVVASDFDADGDQDLFVGARVVPGRFPEIPNSSLLRNTKGKFTDVTDVVAPGLRNAGMVTSAVWFDYDGDGDEDLLVAGEWMTPRLWRNSKGKFNEVTHEAGLDSLEGWWLTMRVADINSDGKPDVVLGNVGMNCRYVPTPGKPLEIFSADFDDNSSLDPIVTFYDGTVQRPTRGKNMVGQHMPYLNRKFPHYKEYAEASIDSLITPEQKAASQRLLVRRFESGILINHGGRYTFEPLPQIAQAAPIYAVVAHDVDLDGKLDLILAGNNRSADGDAIALDAGIGCVLKGDGKGGFVEISPAITGFSVPQNARRMEVLPYNNEAELLFVVCNNDQPLVFTLPKTAK
ncbi:MAG: VCBS repeat-containing protein [Ignavibacteria bacterium]|nr:VCBS repeat-containing protein [Ignavibacteria bacterium]